jgi:hypothetical protein
MQQRSTKAGSNQQTRRNVTNAVQRQTAIGEGPSQSPSLGFISSNNGPLDHLLYLQGMVGNRAVGRLIQAKLAISQPGDQYEREADRVADTVIRMPEPAPHEEEATPVQTKPLTPQITLLVQRESAQLPEEAEEKVVVTSPLVQRVPVAVREDDEEEKVTPKLEPGAALQEEEKSVQAKLETDVAIRRQAKQDEQKKEEALESTPPIQRQMEDEDEGEAQIKPLFGSLSPILTSSPVSAKSPSPFVQRLCAECTDELAQTKPFDSRLFASRHVQAQRKDGPVSIPQVTPSVSANIRALQGGGSPLLQSTRAFFEPRFGADFSQVRIHTGARAAETAKSINARAFTVGRDVAFGKGQYSTESQDGRRLLAHELTHVVQQHAASSLEKAQRQPDTGGMTAGDAPASVAAPTPGPTASIPTAADTQSRDLINKALESRDPADVKRIKNFAAANQAEKLQLINILLNQGWVGPLDEYALEGIWKSFGDDVIAVASTDEGYRLWQNCIDRGAELDDIPAVAKLRGQFESDIKAVVTGYLSQNGKLVTDEMQRLGIPADESAALPAPTPEQTDEMQRMQSAAASVAKLQKAQEEARKIPVGYEIVTQMTPMGSEVTSCNLVEFNPYVRPPMASSPGNILLYCPSGPITPYDKVKEEYDKATKSIEGFLNLYPSLYAISRQGPSTTTAEFAAITNPAYARQQLGIAMHKLSYDIDETQSKLNSGDLNPLDLTPIHDQLLGGLKALSGVDWKLRLPESVVKDMVKDHRFAEALKALGLQTAAAALFMLAPFTGGASIYVMLAGLAVTGVKLYLSTEQYKTLAQAAKTSPKPGTELVTKGQVDEAKMAMEADQIAFALAVLAVGVAGAAKIIRAIRGPTPSAGAGGNGTASEFGDLSGMSRAQADKFLRSRGAAVKTTAGGYTEYKFPDKSTVWIRPDGEVVRTPAPQYGPDGSRINKGARLDQNGNPTTSHNTGEKLKD